MNNKWVEYLFRGRVDAVHRIDLEQFLESLGVLEQIKAGEFICSSCEEIIKVNSITRIILHRTGPKFVCFQCSYQEEMSE